MCRWRALHALSQLSYPARCAVSVHGLYAGRPPATWVVVMYSLCLLAVADALCLRLLPPSAKRRITGLTTALIKPDTPLAEPEPAVRATSLPTTEDVRPLVAGASPEAPGRDMFGRGLRGTPLPSSFERLRTALSAPAPPLCEAPPRSSERLPTGPATHTETDADTVAAGAGASAAPWGPGPGIAAAYRAVSPAAESPRSGPLAEPSAVGRPVAHTVPRTTDTGTPPASRLHARFHTRAGIAPQLRTRAPPGPLHSAPAKDPWHAPAGDRP